MIFLHSFHYFCKAAAELLHLCDPVATLSNFCIIVSFETSLCMAQRPDSVGKKLFCCRCRIHWRCVTWLLTLLTCRSTLPHALRKKKKLDAHNLIIKKRGPIKKFRTTHQMSEIVLLECQCGHTGGRADTSSALISHVYCVMIFLLFLAFCAAEAMCEWEASDDEK